MTNSMRAANSQRPASTIMRILAYCSLTFVLIIAGNLQAETKPHIYRIGFFEAGEHPLHSPFREAFKLHLRQLLAPDSAIFAGKWYWSAHWKPDSITHLAQQIRDSREVDLVVTVGPQAPQALQKAQVNIPILAYQRGVFDPALDTTRGLLQVCYEPDMVAADISALRTLFSPKKLGVVLFADSGTESPDQKFARQLTTQLHLPVAFGTGFNNVGGFAFFKAVQSLPKDVDVVYLGPLYGLRSGQSSELINELHRDSVVIFCADGRSIADEGATASIAGNLTSLPARLAAAEAVAMLRGERTHGGTKKIPTIPQPVLNLGALAMCKRTLGDALLSHTIQTGVNGEQGPPLKMSEPIDYARDGSDQTIASIDQLSAELESNEGWLPRAEVIGEWGTIGSSGLEGNLAGYKRDRGSIYALIEKCITAGDLYGSAPKVSRASRLETLKRSAEEEAARAYITLMRERRLQGLAVRRVAYAVQGNEAVQARKFTKDAGPVEQLRWQAAVERAMNVQFDRGTATRNAEEKLAFAAGRPLGTKYQLDTLSVFGDHFEATLAEIVAALDFPDTLLILAEMFAKSSIKDRIDQGGQEHQTGNDSRHQSGPSLTLRAFAGYSDSMMVSSERPVYGFGGSLRFPLFGSSNRGPSMSLRRSAEESEHAALPAKRTSQIASLLGQIKDDLLASRFSATERQLYETAITEQIPMITTTADPDGHLEQLLDRLFDSESRQVELLFDAILKGNELAALCGWSLSQSDRPPLDELQYHLDRSKVHLDEKDTRK